MEGRGHHSKVGKSFGIGIVGLGDGKGLVKGLSGHPELKIIGICDIDTELLKRIKNIFQIPFAFNELDEMLNRNDIDIIVIYTPDQLHLEQIKSCFEASNHIICTKPLVTSLSEARRLIQLNKMDTAHFQALFQDPLPISGYFQETFQSRLTCALHHLKYTEFFLACLLNKPHQMISTHVLLQPISRVFPLGSAVVLNRRNYLSLSTSCTCHL